MRREQYPEKSSATANKSKSARSQGNTGELMIKNDRWHRNLGQSADRCDEFLSKCRDRLPAFNMPIGVEEATPCILEYSGVKVRLRIPESVVEDLTRVNASAILEAWANKGLESNLNSPVRRKEAQESWNFVLSEAGWEQYRGCCDNLIKKEFSFFLRDWENLVRLADFHEAPVEILIAVALFHAASAGRRHS
jgi:hypothetical protein